MGLATAAEAANSVLSNPEEWLKVCFWQEVLINESRSSGLYSIKHGSGTLSSLRIGARTFYSSLQTASSPL